MANQYKLNDKKMKESESERDLDVIIDKNSTNLQTSQSWVRV